jgi:uncharacterized protein (TIRG00374 family)
LNQEKGKRTTTKTLISLLVSLAVIAALMTQIHPREILNVFRKMNLPLIFGAFILYWGMYLIRALRSIVLIPSKKIKKMSMFSITCLHNFLNYYLPVRTGELSYIYLLQKREQISLGEGFSNLLVCRIYDFIAISVIFFLSVLLDFKEVPKRLSGRFLILPLILLLLYVEN